MKDRLINAVGIGALALICGFGGAALYSVSGLADKRTESYLLENPEMLQRMAQGLQQRDAERRLAAAGDEWREAFPGAVLGNPDGSRTLIEFSDYNCGYCRLSLDHVDELIAQDPELRVVVKEWPIFQGSEAGARMALAAAKQGKYDAFHRALFATEGTMEERIAKAGAESGLDMEQAQADAQSQAVEVELVRNSMLAQELGFTGTPAWVVGSRILEGAQGTDALSETIAAATESAQ